MLTKNIMPFLVSVILMRLATAVPTVISSEIVLAYIGLGLPATMPALGSMVSNAAPQIMQFPHLLLFPTLCVAVICTTFYVAGNAFSDASDPRNHQ
jgi:oligopeptide transport system permease protein